MKILITGMAGLIGSHVSRHLHRLGHTVVGIDDFSGGYDDFIHHQLKCHQVNLVNGDAVSRVFHVERPEVVYHFAAYAAEGLSPFIRNFNYQNNILASANVVNACLNHDVRKLVFTSSMAVYGSQTPPFTEAMHPLPIDPYGVAKAAVERDIQIAGDQFGLDYTIVRPHNVVGIYQNIWDRYRNVIGIWIRQILNQQPVTIFGDGLQTRAFSDIDCYLAPFAKMLTDASGETINIGADKTWTIREAAETLCTVARNLNHKPEIVHLEPRHEVKHAHCNHDKAKDLLGFEDHTDLAATMSKMLVWASHQPERDVRSIPYEVERGVYSFWKHDVNAGNPVHPAHAAA